MQTGIGHPIDRVDGVKKVTGAAKYAAEFDARDLLFGVVVSSGIARGRIRSLDTARARNVAGVVEVVTHENRPSLAWFDTKYQDQVAPPGSPFRALYDAEIHYSDQPIALVVAQSFEAARYAATLVRATYEVEPHNTDIHLAMGEAFMPRRKRSGFSPPKARGDAQGAFAEAPVQIESEFHLAPEHHNPMELFGATVVWEGEGALTVYDKTQGVQNTHTYLCSVFGLDPKKLRLLSPFVGGAFGSGLRPQYQVYLATMAALMLERSVRVVMTRQQMFSFTHRPECVQKVWLGADRDGRLQAIRNHAVTTTSRFENYMETVVNWGGILYRCDNVELDYKIAQIDTHTPGDMRAPGAATGQAFFEIAMDELAYAVGLDPLELRLRNYSDTEEMKGLPYTSKALRQCYVEGAERFGWSRRNHVPRSMREGRELIGWGMATGIWEALMTKTSARAALAADGTLEVATASADIGTGTYTVMTQVASEALGLPPERISALLGDSSLPASPVEGGSWGAASVGAAVRLACDALGQKLLDTANTLGESPLQGARFEDVALENGRIFLKADRERGMTFETIMRETGLNRIEAEDTARPGMVSAMTKARNTHSAIFAEVRVDEELGVVRVTRIVNAVAAGRIINPKTARSQILGGVVFGMGMALEEESMADHRLGRFMNHSLAEYHIPVNADVHDIDVIFVDEPDSEVNPLGVKGVGEIGVVGTPAAIANAIFHATGKRVRELPITIDKLL